MKVLIVNYRFYVSGGPERYLFNLKELLEAHGHQVIPYSVRYERNEASPYACYFAAPLSSEEEVYFAEQTWTIGSFVKTVERAFYSAEVYRSLRDLTQAVRPDFAVVLHYLRKLSPAVLTALADAGVPFVVRLSDFGMVCPNSHLLRNGEICELCVTGGTWHSVRYRCVQHSFGASMVNYAATKFHHMRGYFDLVPIFITPSRMLRDMMIAAGWDSRRLEHLPTFVYPSGVPACQKRRQVIFAGRIDPQKGIDILVKAVAKLQAIPEQRSFTTIIAGDGKREYVKELQSLCTKVGARDVVFAGVVAKARLFELFAESAASVVPSISYDNMPNVILESMASGTPVIASNQGSFPELVMHGENGLLFQTRDVGGLADALVRILDHDEQTREMGEKARAFVELNHSPESHYERIMRIFSELTT